MVSFKSIGAKVGKTVDILYPIHGSRNILRSIEGVVEKRGTGPNGKYIVVKCTTGGYRSLSLKKIVVMN
jgi:hypothetical protein